MTPCPALGDLVPLLACFAPGPEPVCIDCGGTFEPREWRPTLTTDAYGLTREAS